MKIRLDLHIHSGFSPDSLTGPGEIIRLARRRGLDGVAVVDHNTVRGGLAALELNSDPGFIVIPGAEYSTEYGHVLGLFLYKEIDVESCTPGGKPHGKAPGHVLPFEGVVEAIHAQGGIAVLAHPFQSRLSLQAHVFDGPVRVDAIEGFNARAGTRANPNANALAGKCSTEYGIPALGGSDAHLAREIGRAYTLLDLGEPLSRMPELAGHIAVAARHNFGEPLCQTPEMRGLEEPLEKMAGGPEGRLQEGSLLEGGLQRGSMPGKTGIWTGSREDVFRTGSEGGICIRESHCLVKEAILAGRAETFGKHSPRAVVPITELIKAHKRKTYGKVPLIVGWLLVSLLGPVGFWLETALRRVREGS